MSTIFTFTNKKPDPETIWKELESADIPTGQYQPTYCKLLLWITLSATNDFKQAKESANKFLSGEISHEDLYNGFTSALANMEQPITGDIPTTLHINGIDGNLNYFNSELYPTELTLPITLFRELFSVIENIEVVVQLAERVFIHNNFELNTFIRAVMTTEKNNLNILLDLDRFLSDLQGNFNIGEVTSTVIISSIDELRDYITNTSLMFLSEQQYQSSINPIPLPSFKYEEN